MKISKPKKTVQNKSGGPRTQDGKDLLEGLLSLKNKGDQLEVTPTKGSTIESTQAKITQYARKYCLDELPAAARKQGLWYFTFRHNGKVIVELGETAEDFSYEDLTT